VPGLAELVQRMLAKDPAQRPSSSAAVLAQLNGPTPAQPVSNATQVLPFAATPVVPLHEELLGQPVDDELEKQTASHAAPRRRLPFAKVLAGAGVVVAGVVAAILLREGVSQEPPAVAGGTPTVAPTVVTKTTAKPKPTPTPTPKPKETPTPKKTPKKTPPKQAESRTANQLRTLAQLLRQDQQGDGSKAVREAAKDLDEAAKALGEGKEGQASDRYRSALRRLGTAQRTQQWQPSQQEFVLIAAINRDLGRVGWGDNNDERDSDSDSDE
jgi:serine/threonine-protein kinase